MDSETAAAYASVQRSLRKFEEEERQLEERKELEKRQKAAWMKKSVWERMRIKWNAKTACQKGCLIACQPLCFPLYIGTMCCLCNCCCQSTCDGMLCGEDNRVADGSGDKFTKYG